MSSNGKGKTVQGAKVLHANREASGNLLEAAEKKLGLRCSGCGRRIHNGFRVTRFLERFDPEEMKPVVSVAQANVCVRDDCDAAGESMSTAHLVEKVENVWLDEERGGAPRSDVIPAAAPRPAGQQG